MERTLNIEVAEGSDDQELSEAINQTLNKGIGSFFNGSEVVQVEKRKKKELEGPASPLGKKRGTTPSRKYRGGSVYGSRHDKNYSDDDSQGGKSSENDEDEVKEKLQILKRKEDKLRAELESNLQAIEMEKQKEVMGANVEHDIKPNPRFRNYSDLLSALTKSKNVVTKWPLIQVMISYNSKYAITATKKNDHECFIKMYNLETY